MYVLVGTSEIDVSRADEAVAIVNNGLIPGLSQAPGFVSATFARSAEGIGHSMVVFDNEEAARTVAATAADRVPADGPIKLISLEVCEVTGKA
ncbi:MAG: hypothetical protein ACR2PK_17710 [Acidimicrobiales bacterium]